jgi:membrane protein DedA with SNARE-associated domain
MSLAPLGAIFLATLGPVVGLMILYWIIRFAVRHGIEDAWRRRSAAPTESGYWDPARFGNKQ